MRWHGSNEEIPGKGQAAIAYWPCNFLLLTWHFGNLLSTNSPAWEQVSSLYLMYQVIDGFLKKSQGYKEKYDFSGFIAL